MAVTLGWVYQALGLVEDSVVARKADFTSPFANNSEEECVRFFDSNRRNFVFFFFFDEADSMEHGYGREVDIVFLTKLDEHRHTMGFAVARYPGALDRGFFGMNEGLKRRFLDTFRFDKYTPDELARVTFPMVRGGGGAIWSLPILTQVRFSPRRSGRSHRPGP